MKKRHQLYKFLFLVLLMGCSNRVEIATNYPIVTPGAIDRLKVDLNLKGYRFADWNFNEDIMLVRKGAVGEFITDHDLALFDWRQGQVFPIEIMKNKQTIFGYEPAQGPGNQIVYDDHENLILYNTETKVMRGIGEGNFPSFSLDGTRIAYLNQTNLFIYNISNNWIELNIPIDVPESKQSGALQPKWTHWRPETDKVDFIFSWKNDQTGRVYKSEIQEVDLETRQSTTLYQSENIVDFSWSPDGRLLVLNEIDLEKWSTTIKVINPSKECELWSRSLPFISEKIRWSPNGDWIAFETLDSVLHMYLMNVNAVLGDTYNRLGCQIYP